MTVAELVQALERRAAEAEAMHATAPVAAVLKTVVEELRPLADANGNGGRPAPPADRLLTAAQVAEFMQVSERYVYEHAARWPFTRRVSRRCVRFSEAGLRRHLERAHER